MAVSIRIGHAAAAMQRRARCTAMVLACERLIACHWSLPGRGCPYARRAWIG